MIWTTSHSQVDQRDDWPDPDRDGYSYPHDVTRFYHIYNMHLFGDPSLRINGTLPPDTTPPTTTALLERWVNKEDLDRVRAGVPYYHEVELIASDLGGTGVLSTHYRYPLDKCRPRGWSAWQIGSHFLIPVALERLPVMEGMVSEVEYYSIDRIGNVEARKTATFGYDFTSPVSRGHSRWRGTPNSA